jgi:hypothetical protein
LIFNSFLLSAELIRFRDLRRRILEYDGELDNATLRKAVEEVCDLHDAIRTAVLSVLEDEEAASRLRGRLDEMETRLRRVEKRAAEKRAAEKRECALLAMIEAGLKGVEAPGLRVAVRRTPPILTVSDENLIPETYRVSQPTCINYQAIREALEGGTDVPGAALSDAKPYLSVRTD